MKKIVTVFINANVVIDLYIHTLVIFMKFLPLVFIATGRKLYMHNT